MIHIYRILSVVFICLFVSVVFVLLYKIKRLNSKNHSLQGIIEAQMKHFDSLVLFQEEFKSAWHDYKNHLICISCYLKDKDYAALGDYISKLDASLKLQPEYMTGSIAADSILAAKKKLAEDNGILFECYISLPRKIEIDDFDISIILSNILDNSIDACIKLENEAERKVKLDIGYKNDYIHIRLENSAKSGKEKENEGIFRGIGLKNVTRAVLNYEGSIENEYLCGLHVTRIIIKNKKV